MSTRVENLKPSKIGNDPKSALAAHTHAHQSARKQRFCTVLAHLCVGVGVDVSVSLKLVCRFGKNKISHQNRLDIAIRKCKSYVNNFSYWPISVVYSYNFGWEYSDNDVIVIKGFNKCTLCQWMISWVHSPVKFDPNLCSFLGSTAEICVKYREYHHTNGRFDLMLWYDIQPVNQIHNSSIRRWIRTYLKETHLTQFDRN